ncbi:alpha/beta hydrolase [Flavobacterium sp. LC2016-01]|uniref:alpha/beta hydrolase n=1 Tax=Flavobacterium sp. LC2016-01 TaxID=2675876 RepID=UPI0012BA6CC2|nr:alpha/beta hydrolase [Flavobacterium sp. LC2016-01]MTH14974.1 alpha/beta hydrolase [Flavobacterium sp. LC2016-01]
MKPRLLILSDLFGGENPDGIKFYTDKLESSFDIQYYDVLKLANINASGLGETEIHSQFLNGGIERAIENLLQLEKEKVTVLGFSIGGTVAWKASLKALKTDYLFAVSSTRLRYENELPDCNIKLYFGENDLNKPNLEWFFNLNVSNKIFDNQKHQLYLENNNAYLICDDILKAFIK